MLSRLPLGAINSLADEVARHVVLALARRRHCRRAWPIDLPTARSDRGRFDWCDQIPMPDEPPTPLARAV